MQQPHRQNDAPGRAPLAVLLAAVLLAVIGSSLGVVAGRRVRASESTTGEGPRDDAETPRPGSGVSGRPSSKPEVETQVKTSASPRRGTSLAPVTSCPAETATAAKGKVKLLRYIETDPYEVWLCASTSDGDTIWYQGLRKSSPTTRYPEQQIIQGKTAIFLPGVTVEQEDGGVMYSVSNIDAEGNRTTYHVRQASLTIVRQDGTEEVQKVTRFAP